MLSAQTSVVSGLFSLAADARASSILRMALNLVYSDKCQSSFLNNRVTVQPRLKTCYKSPAWYFPKALPLADISGTLFAAIKYFPTKGHILFHAVLHAHTCTCTYTHTHTHTPVHHREH